MIVGDAAFPLKQNMMRPYPGRNLPEPQAVFDYHLSRARRIIENSFGILASRWRIFRRTLIATPDHAVIYTKAAIALHNFLHTMSLQYIALQDSWTVKRVMAILFEEHGEKTCCHKGCKNYQEQGATFILLQQLLSETPLEIIFALHMEK